MSSRDITVYSPGAIPFEESVSPTGARVYTIPISTAAGYSLSPNISLVYNSQSGNNIVGFGWGISGLSSISIRNANLYYDGYNKGAIYDSLGSDYSLDGMPLVQSSMGITNYSLTTARGNVLVQLHEAPSGRAAYFTALYPNGSTAFFGYPNNTEPRTTYPITELTDINGNTISFSYALYGNCYYISNISYGDNASIHFTYTSRNDGTPYQFATAGNYVYFPQKTLTSIESMDGIETVCEYSLQHEFVDGVTVLKELHCSSGSSEVPPLLFTYGVETENGSSSPSFELKEQNLFTYYFRPSADTLFLYKRGKMIPGNANDGVVILPSFSTYDKIDREWSWQEFGYCYKYGSKYNENQEFICNFTAHHNTFQRIITAEEGFQLIEAVDVNGDGIDELVKINNSSPSAGITNYKITIYSFNTNGYYSSSSFNVSVSDGTHNAVFNNPVKSYYRFGNFRGDGKTMLLIMTRNASRFALVDLNARIKVSESSIFTTGDDEDNLVLVADFENDGKSDLCHITDSGMDVYSVSTSSGTSFSFRKTYNGISKSQLYIEPLYTMNGIPQEVKAKIYTLDLNGDGYLDIAAAPALNFEMGNLTVNSNTWNISRFNGKQFSTETSSLFIRGTDDEIIFLDVDKDGLPDMLQLHNSDLFYIPNINGRFTTSYNYAELTLPSYAGLIPGDYSIFGSQCDVLVVDGPEIQVYGFSINHSLRRSIKRVSDSFGVIHNNIYESTGGDSNVYFMDNSRSYSTFNGYYRGRNPLYVIYACQKQYNDMTISSEGYFYWDAIYNNRGLGFCGFGKILSLDLINTVYTTTILNPEKFGVPIQISSAKSTNGTPYSTIVNTYDENSTTYGKLNPRLTSSVATNALTGVEITTTYTYGSHDFPTTVLTSRRIGTGTSQTEQVKRTYEHSVTPSKYVLGVVTEESVIKEGDGASTLKWKEKSFITYDTYYRPLTNKKYVGKYGIIRNPRPIDPIGDSLIIHSGQLPGGLIEPQVINDSLLIPEPILDYISYDATNLVSETRWQYDTHGNVISETTAPYGASEFTGSTFTYDNNGRHMTSKTNAIGRTITFNNYNKFGQPRVVVNDRGQVTYYSYDDWGNAISVSHPDGTVEQTSIAWGGTGLYTETYTVTGRPESVTHYDALGREVRSGVKRFNGQWQWVDKEYNSKGLLYRTSLPYRGTSATYWKTYAYDQYNRPISLTEASGRVSSWSYSGTSISTIKDGITSTRTADANGNIVSVTDAGGTITYTLRDDGQPSKVTAPGNVTTSFSYDDYGRRTKIVDPSAGTQTDAYLWNSDGSSRVTHTGPNGSVKTYRDKYGRKTLVERPGEYNTTYSYDSYGRLSIEQSTNSTGMEYTYDNYDRIITTKETVPDNKWLRKTITYGTASIVSGVKYTTQGGDITTETYTYSNGHNTGISLTDGTVVWSLCSENDLGMPTEITSGAISREYGYTVFGMPTFRKMDQGDLQYFTYQFDVATGNLLSRSDYVNNQTESFGYDTLNRLTAIGNRQISYADNGNILSIDGVGTMAYGSTTRPYRLTSLTPEEDGLVPNRLQSVSYTCYNRPSILTEGGRSAAFTYNGDGDRVKMFVADSTGNVLTRYHIGGRYEYDQTPSGTKERLYLGGDAYSAPMVYQRENNSGWTAYNIGRDYLGNITHIATTSGTLVAEYSYDPWGRLRDPETLNIYDAGYEPELFLGRGFTGHEHLTWFGLINMNARLYDPLLGRFLSPDPYVQAPDFTQNFNRYSYALNNPLRYTDESGEFVFSMFLGPVGAVIDAACWGALIGGASYTINVAFSDGAFSNWNWSDFGKAAGWGAVSGAVSFGIGEFCGALSGVVGELGTELIRSSAHGLAQGSITYLQGGSFWSGFTSGMLGSFVGSGYSALNLDEQLGAFGMLAFSSVTSGFASVLNGDSFLQGACIGLTTAGLNHLQHKTEEYKFFNRLRKHYERGNGEDLILTIKEFNYLIRQGHIDAENAILGDDGYYKTSIDFYNSSSDLKYSFGRATVKYTMSGNNLDYVGFYDYYDFDSKDWGERSYYAEIITRTYGALSNGTGFNIYYGKQFFVK